VLKEGGQLYTLMPGKSMPNWLPRFGTRSRGCVDASHLSGESTGKWSQVGLNRDKEDFVVGGIGAPPKWKPVFISWTSC
jgi:hypothetical protein